MVTVALFGAVFSSVIWLFCALRFVSVSLSGMSFFDAGIVNVLLYVLFVCLPIFLLWLIFGFVGQFWHNRTSERQLFKLFAQMKKNQEYSDLLARIMLESEQNLKSCAALDRFDLLVSDINELLSEIILRCRLASPEQIEHLWSKVQNGGKWSFGKVVIENYNRQPGFQKRVFTDASQDNLLAGTILEFCARYQTLLSLLEKNDREKIFLNIVETGVLGKVFAVMAPVADEIRRTRDAASSFTDTKPTTLREELSQQELRATKPSFVAAPEVKSVESEKKSFFSRLMGAKKEQEPEVPHKDAFSLALERSFSGLSAESPELKAPTVGFEPVKMPEPVLPKTTELQPTTPELTVKREPVLDAPSETEQTLSNLKKEWQQIDQKAIEPQTTETSDDDLTYPFGGWTDADNYQK